MTFAWKDSGSKTTDCTRPTTTPADFTARGLETADVVKGRRYADRLAAAGKAAQIGSLKRHEEHGDKAEDHEDPDIKLECAILVHLYHSNPVIRS